MARSRPDYVSEGPLEKGAERLGESAESQKRAASERMEEAAGKIERTGTGMAGKTAGWWESMFGSIADYVRQGSNYVRGMNVRGSVDSVTRSIRKNPTQAVLIALGVGLALGLVARRR